MADIQPLRALHYEPAAAGSLADVVAPPYDVIDEAQRYELLERSPYNVVAIDLPKPEGPSDDQYARAGELFEHWQRDGVIARDEQPAIWAHVQDYTGPDGVRRTRRGFFCRVRIEPYGPGAVRPHERTHPGPKEDRLRLTRATRANLSPIFSLFSDPTDDAWTALEAATEGDPWGDVTDAEGTRHRIWRVSDPEAIAAVQRASGGSELLIADGHHRYETMLAYAAERDDGPSSSAADATAPGEHAYILMCLVALEDPGLTIFPTHRLLSGLDEGRREALQKAFERDFVIEQVALEEIAPEPGEGRLVLGFYEGADKPALRLTLREQRIADEALLERSQAYRELDTGVLEELLLKSALGLSDEDISHFNGLFYARDTAEALAMVDSGKYDAAFLVRPTRVRQVQDLAAAGENMPPKSTFFYPKLLTGLLFNPL